MSAPANASESAPIRLHHSWAPDPEAYDRAFDGLQFIFSGATSGEQPSVAELVAGLSVGFYDKDSKNGGDPALDSRASWHRNTTDLSAWIKAHAYQEARDWGDDRLAEWFQENPDLARRFGFTAGDGGLDAYTGDPPSQSRLWEVWNEEFSEVLRDACTELAEHLFLTAYENRLPLPTGPFDPEDRDIQSERGVRRLTEEKTRAVTREMKPIVNSTFWLNRENNTRVPEGTFWEAHANVGMQQDKCIDAYRMATTRPLDQQHTGRTHRHHLQNHSAEDVREMLQESTKKLVRKARHKGELQGKIWAAIDVTKGAPWTGNIEWTDDDSPEDPYILGYKEKNSKEIDYYFQWASIQIVGHDIPLVLDAFPIRRGLTKDEIVDTLLEGALDVVPDIDLVMMDREFDSEGVKNVCDTHGVYYLNPARKHTSERARCSDLRRSGKKVGLETQRTLTGPDRVRMYLPARNTDVFEPVEADEDDETEEQTEEEKRHEIRQDLVEAFVAIGGEDENEDGHGFEDLIGDMQDEEDQQEQRGNDEDADAYALFETNHPALDTDKKSEEGLLSAIRGFIKRYSHRWGIENGYKQLKKFRVRTRSKDHEYRFFCFAFACVLYNVWRLVDLLVKVAIEDNPDYSPRVKAGVFLTLAGKYMDLDPPD